jgi:MFS family permease
MNILHSFYCWGQLLVALLTTILLWKLGTQNWFYIPLFWSILPIYNLLSLLKLDIPDYPQSNVPLKQKIGIHRLFVLLIIMMIAAGASELTMSQWASTFAQITLHLPVLWGNLAGPVLFSLLMGLGRIIFGLLWEKINFLWILTFCSLSCVGCYVLAIFSKTPIFALLACSFTGFTVSAMWPYTFSIASKKFPLGGTKMFGILAIFGDVGGSLGPWIAGIVSMNGVVPKMIENGKSGIKEGLFFSILFPLLFFAMVVLVRKYFSKAIIKFAKVKE